MFNKKKWRENEKSKQEKIWTKADGANTASMGLRSSGKDAERESKGFSLLIAFV